MVRPHVAVVTSVAPVHLEYFELDRGHRASQVGNFLRPRTRGHGDHQSRQCAISNYWPNAPRRSPAGHVLSFGAHVAADARLVTFEPLDRRIPRHRRFLRHADPLSAGRAGQAHGNEFARRPARCPGGRDRCPGGRRHAAAASSRRPAAASAARSSRRADPSP